MKIQILKNQIIVKLTVVFVITLLLFGCKITKDSDANINLKAIDLFQSYIVGDFNNKKQIDLQMKNGKQTHPYAIHINRVCDSKIVNSPVKDGFWLLEESYYTKPNQTEVEVKPYLFLFEAEGINGVKLTPYTLPKSSDVRFYKNDNDDLFLNYNDLTPSVSFKPAFYTLKNKIFYLNAPNELPNGMKFTLIEEISKNQLSVMELLEKDGKSLTPYDTPIIYDRVN